MCAMDEYRNEYRMHVEEKMSAKKVSWARITKGILCLTRITNIPIPKVQKKPGRLNNRMKWRAPGTKWNGGDCGKLKSSWHVQEGQPYSLSSTSLLP